MLFGMVVQGSAQHLRKVADTEDYVEYLLENDSLKLIPAKEVVAPYRNLRNGLTILEQEVRTVERSLSPEQPTYQLLKPEQFNAPLYRITNIGTSRGEEMGIVQIQTIRTNGSTPASVKIIERLRFRIEKRRDEASGFAKQRTTFGSARRRSSLFATGRWFKIPIAQSGIYQLDLSYLQELGLSAGEIDPDRIQIWSSPGVPLPERNSEERHTISQLPIILESGDDGSFDEGDRILFYAKDPHQETWSNNQLRYRHTLHPYSRTNYLFLTVAESPGLRLSPRQFSGPTTDIRSFRDFIWLEQERSKTEENIKSGREWYGQELNNEGANARNSDDDRTIWAFKPKATIFTDTIPGLRGDIPAQLTLRTVGRSTRSLEFDVFVENDFLDDIPMSGIIRYVGSEGSSARDGTINRQILPPDDDDVLTVQLHMKNNEASSQGWVDYLELNIGRDLVAERGVLSFNGPRNGITTTLGRFLLTGFDAAPLVLDVTDPVAPVQLDVSETGGSYAVTAPTQPSSRYHAQSRLFTPALGSEIANQDIGSSTGSLDFLIITAEPFLDQANDLAGYRSSRDGLTTMVVTQEQVFNEFSAGVPDIVGIRDFIRYLYEQAMASGREPLRYVLFFGDTTYDYKGIEASGSLENHIFTFQSQESINRIDTYGSDDFFALLDSTEGAWNSGSSSNLIDLAVGRLPVQTASEARTVVSKIKRYESAASFGSWRNRLTFAADDDVNGSFNDRDLHTYNSDFTAETIPQNRYGLRFNKVYQFAYPVVNTAQGRRQPAATQAFIDAFNRGSLIVNYSGHGNERVLADEQLFNIRDLSELNNLDRLSILISATCSFGRFDDTIIQSGAERLFLYSDGGTAGAFTTSRVVYTDTQVGGTNNFALNISLMDEFFRPDAEGLPRRMGDIYYYVKQTTAGRSFNSRKFILLGDPTMRVAIPQQEAVLTQINRAEIDTLQSVVTARALDRVTLEGQIQNQNGLRNREFNGEATVEIYDARRFANLPSLEWITPENNCFLDDCGYFVENDLLFNGRVSVTNGEFQSEFIIPKDISFTDSTGRVLVYARSSETDANGSFDRIRFNGINTDAASDAQGPQMDVYLNEDTFVNGMLVNDSPRLIVELTDQSGINTTGLGIGHEIIATIDTEPEQSFTLNNFYESNLDDFTSGRINFPISDLPSGAHNLMVRAWDVHNNPSEREIQFEVAKGQQLEVRNIFNYPNPMSEETEFIFEHNQPGNPLDIAIRIFTLSGRPVDIIRREGLLTNGNYVRIPWSGRDRDGNILANGTYIYVVEIRAETPEGRQRAEKIEKLVVIR